MRKTTAAAILGVGLAMAVWGFLIEPSLLIQRDVQFDHWPGPPLKIAFLTDVHAGSLHIDREYLETLVSKVNAQVPDLILFGGDLVIGKILGSRPMPIAELASLLKELKARLGVFSVLGNHDWWHDGDKIRKTLEENGIQVLDNQAKLIQVDPDFNFWLVGLGDSFTNRTQADVALSQVTSAAPKILFMHDPAALLEVKSRFFLALAGHLHGGQVSVPGLGAIVTTGKAPRTWANGRVDLEWGSLFVSKGIGTSILPVRFNAPPEFVMVELRNNSR